MSEKGRNSDQYGPDSTTVESEEVCQKGRLSQQLENWICNEWQKEGSGKSQNRGLVISRHSLATTTQQTRHHLQLYRGFLAEPESHR